MAKFFTVVPCFPVADVGTTMNWYEQHLGFTSEPFPQHAPFVFCILRRDEVEIMLQRVEDYQKPELYQLRSGGVWDAYIRIAGIREFYELVSNRLKVLRPLNKQPYRRWEFEIQDPNGYVLVFSESVE